MPVILPEDKLDARLSGEAGKEILVPYPADEIIVRPISPRVDSPKNDAPQSWNRSKLRRKYAGWKIGEVFPVGASSSIAINPIKLFFQTNHWLRAPAPGRYLPAENARPPKGIPLRTRRHLPPLRPPQSCPKARSKSVDSGAGFPRRSTKLL